MNVRECAVKIRAEAEKLRARWPKAQVTPGVGTFSISVSLGDEEYVVAPYREEKWSCRFWVSDSAVDAVVLAMEDERDKAKTKLAHLAECGVA